MSCTRDETIPLQMILMLENILSFVFMIPMYNTDYQGNRWRTYSYYKSYLK